MAHDYEYSWESSSTYTPPRREGIGWYLLVAVILALSIHVGALIAAGNTFYRAEMAEEKELEVRDIRLTVAETEIEEIAEAPPEEEIERPTDDHELIEDIDDALADLENIEIDIDPTIEDAALPEMKIEKPLLEGVDDGELLEPVVGLDSNNELTDPGKIQVDFPEAKANQLVVVDEGASLADVIDPDAVVAQLGKMKGSGGTSEVGVIDGYTGLEAYSKMSPGDLQRNKASIGSDLLFEFNKATLRDDARLTLMTVAMLIDRNPDMYCWVEGHTDTIGGDAFNMSLSKRRSEAVKNWLVKALQLDSSRIIVRPFGRSNPIVLEGDRDQQAPNRRVDIKMRKALPTSEDDPPGKVLVKPGVAIPVNDDEDDPKDEPKPMPKPRDPFVDPPKAIPVPEDEKIPKAIPVPEEEEKKLPPKAILIPEDEEDEDEIPKAIPVED